MLIHVHKFDWALLIFLICILLCGVIAIYSASTTKIGNEFQTENYYLKQILWIAISILIFLIVLKIPYPIIDFFTIPLYIFSILLLIVVLFFPEIKGSHRWITLGLFNIQPSELAKITTLLLLSKILSKPHIREGQIIIRSFPIVILPVFLILLEPDLGTSLVFWVILFSLLAFSRLPVFYLILIISPLISIITSFNLFLFIIYMVLLCYLLYKMRLSLIIVGSAAIVNTFIFIITPILWNSLKIYQQNRILSFIDPMRDPFGAGYQIIQAKIAIGSGGILGKGFLLGTQKNLNFLPEHHTDFIFSVIGEEFGFLGCIFILIMFFLFLYKIARSINKIKIREMRYTIVGILSYLSFQVFVNIGMNLGVVPTTGIPLPFISYGGSNLLVNIFAVSLVLKYLNERRTF